MPKLKELIEELNNIYEEILISNVPVFNTSVAIKLKNHTKNVLARIEIIHKRLIIHFPNEIELRENLITRRTEILSALNTNLLKSETVKKSALMYLKFNFHFLSDNTYKYHLLEYFAKEINNIFENVSYTSFNMYTQRKLINPEEILLEIYRQNLCEIKEMLKERKKRLSIKNIKTVFAIYGHKFSVFIYLFSFLFIFLHDSL